MTAYFMSMERSQAIDAARNLLNSKIAKALLEENKFPHSRLKLQVARINSDVKRRETLLKHEKRLFTQRGLLHNFEPTMVVERPARPESMIKQHEDMEKTTPHYMSGLEKNQTTQVRLDMPKVDAFKVTRKRKKNLWEEKYSDKDLNEKFRSIILHSPPLTDGEQYDLDKGWIVYRPVSRMEESLRQNLKSKKEDKYRLAKSYKTAPTLSSSVFITQLTGHKQTTPKNKFKNEDEKGKTRRSNTRNSTASGLLQVKLQEINSGEFDDEKLEQFKELRKQQKRLYHRYL